MARILLIDDQPEYQILLKQVAAPHVICVASTATEALKQAAVGKPDLVLLDIGLPDGDGLHLLPLLRELQGNAPVPIILVSGRTALSDRVTGFAVGADDYVVKPFEPLELRARIEAHLRRQSFLGERNLVYGDLRLDLDRMRCFRVKGGAQDQDLNLTPAEFRLLAYFIKHEGHILNRDQLISVVWSEDVHVLERTIDRHISYLKAKLNSNTCVIETVRGEGYRFSRRQAQDQGGGV